MPLPYVNPKDVIKSEDWNKLIQVVNSRMGYYDESGDDIWFANDAVRDESSEIAYVKNKEIKIYSPPAKKLKIYFEFKGISYQTAYPDGAYARIYINGIPVGDEHFNGSGEYMAVTEIVDGIKDGDLLQVYIRVYEKNFGRVRNFRILGKILTNGCEITL